MTNHALLDKVIDSLLAEQGLAPETRAGLDESRGSTSQDHWLRRTMKTGPVELPPPSRR